MLPKSLSNGACSLNGGQDRYALSALMELDEEGNLRSVDLAKTLIRSTVRGVYDQVNDLFERGETSEFYEKYRAAYPTLTLMRELYEILARRHAARGALDLEQRQHDDEPDTGHRAVHRNRVRHRLQMVLEAGYDACADGHHRRPVCVQASARRSGHAVFLSDDAWRQ